MNAPSAQALMAAYEWACDLELQAFKPGNVSVHSAGHDMTVEDFRQSAEVSAPHLCDFDLHLGERIFRAIEATRAVCGCNTNLGIVLLCAPLLQACRFRSNTQSLRESLKAVLQSTSLEDADGVYRAIRLAAPAGLGTVSEQDVAARPKVTLRQAMAMAKTRDRIAWQYACDFADVFDFGVRVYHRWLIQWGKDEWAAVGLYVTLLDSIPDSHIERKFGNRYTRTVATQIELVEQAMSKATRPEQIEDLLRETDAMFKSAEINPGTTADLTVAILLAVRLDSLVCCPFTRTSWHPANK